MDYAALKAWLADQPAGQTDAQLAAALVAPSITVQVPVSWQQVRVVAQESPNMSWARITVRAEQTPALPPVTPLDAAILVARNAVSMADSQSVDPAKSAQWTAFQNGLTALQAQGDLTAADVAAIVALASQAIAPAADIDCPELLAIDQASIIYHIGVARSGAFQQ